MVENLNTHILFSVIIPLYNCEKFVAQAIESVLQQSYKNFELIIINDGSTDKSLEIVNKYMEDSRITIINQANRGLFHTRLVGLRAAKGEFCVFLDSDDYLEKNALMILNTVLSTNHAEVLIYRNRRVWQSGKEMEMPTRFKTDEYLSREAALQELCSDNKVNNLFLKAFRKDLIDTKTLERYPKITLGEDGLFTLYLFKNADKIFCISDVLYNYRMVDGSMSRSVDKLAYQSNRIITKSFLTSLGTESEIIRQICIDGIYRKFLKKTSSIALYGKYRVGKSKKDYMELLKEIANDSVFKEIYRQHISKQSFIVQFPLRLLYKKKYYILFLLKRLITPFMIIR